MGVNYRHQRLYPPSDQGRAVDCYTEVAHNCESIVPEVTTEMKEVGFFCYQSSLRDAVRTQPQADEARIALYLRRGVPIAWLMSLWHDALDPSCDWRKEVVYLTDGEWYWPNYYPYYVEKYHVRVPEEFRCWMQEHRWRRPLFGPVRWFRTLRRLEQSWGSDQEGAEDGE